MKNNLLLTTLLFLISSVGCYTVYCMPHENARQSSFVARSLMGDVGLFHELVKILPTFVRLYYLRIQEIAKQFSAQKKKKALLSDIIGCSMTNEDNEKAVPKQKTNEHECSAAVYFKP